MDGSTNTRLKMSISKVFRFSIWMFCFYSSGNLLGTGTNIASEKAMNEDGSLPPDMTLTEVGKKKAEALAHFAQAFIKLKENRRFTSDILDDIIATLKNDPTANVPLQLYLTAFETPGFKLKGDGYKELYPVAKLNPAALKLNLVAVLALMKEEKIDEAIELLRNCLKYVEENGLVKPSADGDLENSSDTPSEIEKDKRGIPLIELYITLTGLYERKNDFKNGRAILDKVDPAILTFDERLKYYEAAALFYNKMEGIVSDDSFLSLFESDKKACARLRDKSLDEVVKLCSTRHVPVGRLGSVLDLLRKLGRVKDAENMVVNNMSFNPEDIASKVVLAAIYYENKKYVDATRIWSRVVEQEKATGSAKPVYYYELGRSALAAKEYKEAIDAFELYLILRPKDQLALYQLALACFDSGNYPKALRKLSKITMLPEANLLASHCFQKLDNIKMALDEMRNAEERAIKVKRQKFLNKTFYVTFAFYAEKMNDIKLVEECIEKALKLNPDDPDLRNFMGYVWADHDMKLNMARDYIQKALDKQPDNAAYLDSMAWVLFRMKDYEKAKFFVLKSIEKSGESPDPVILDHAGDIFNALGDRKKAAEFWKRSLESESSDLDRKTVEKKLKQALN